MKIMEDSAKIAIAVLQGLHVLHGKRTIFFLRRFKSQPLGLIVW